MQSIIWNSVLDKYFDETTMSLHIKANRPMTVKKWQPGGRKPFQLEVMTKDALYALIDVIFQEVEARDDGFLEIDRSLSKVLQLGPYRIVIVYPPLSDGLEMTVVKPTTRLTITDYNLQPEVLDLLKNKAKGILVSWAPWSGKTTFAQALVDLYEDEDHVIKTIESPRDLLVSDDVVQYSFTYGSHEEIRDILLLSRPDYTVYDEVRNKHDFDLYKDLRLTGIGLIGVIHATKPIDGIQRFLGNIELGIIPQVIDTVIYIDKGKIGEMYHLKLSVKVPDGMMSDDLARPVVQVSSFFTKKPAYEIYTFGEQIVVMPLDGESTWWSKRGTGVSHYAKQAIQQRLTQVLPCDFLVGVGTNDIHLYVPESYKWRIIGKSWATINELEKSLGLSVNVKTFDEVPLADVKVDVKTQKNMVDIIFPQSSANQQIQLLIHDEVFAAKADPQATLTIKKKNIINLIQKKWFVVVDSQKL
jgi:ATPase